MGVKKRHQTLSLLSFNTLGTPFFAPYITKRYRKVTQIINDADLDIVCLQEIFTYFHFYLFKKKLTNFPFSFFQRNPLGPRGGLVIFSKIPLHNQEFRTFSYPKGAFVPFYTKIAQQGMLSAEIIDLPLRIITTHLASDTVHNLTPKNKLYKLISSQSREVAETSKNYSQKKQSVILAGDFNIAKHSTLYQDLLKDANLNDVFVNDEAPTYHPDRVSYFYQAPADRCDFIFTKPYGVDLKVLKTGYAFSEAEILSNGEKSYLSDHIGLHCILEVNK